MGNSEPFPVIQTVFASVKIEGVHYWKDAPEAVAYLRNLHRHVFHIKAYKVVQHTDRDVEFIMLGHQVRQVIDDHFKVYTQDGTYDLGQTSCEMLAEFLLGVLQLQSCEVSEDGENGAVIIRQ